MLNYNRNSKYHQGFYHPKNIDKYISRDVPFYRSGIELKFMKWCDDNPNVIKWLAEGVVIPYFDKVKNKWRKYYVDNYVEILEGDVIKKYLIEIKPLKETRPPDKKRGKKKSTLLYEQTTHLTNTCKWSFAVEYCKKNNLDFLLLGYTVKGGFEQVKLNF